jgi:histidine ammonia-lyase
MSVADPNNTVVLHGPGVTVDDVVAVARRHAPVELSAAAIDRIAAARTIVERLAANEAVYGISTGFGALANVSIPPERRADLQVALVRSHAAGMGPLVEDEVVRALTFLRARTLALGASGARVETVQGLVNLVNHRISPHVHEHGSLGASGDLAPLAHVALALIGEGTVEHRGVTKPAGQALSDANLRPLVLAEKEGLALTNGTDGILGMLCLAVHDARSLLTHADIACALTVEALLATDRAYAADLQALRPHPGQATSAANLRALLQGSDIVASHRYNDSRVQDAYSIRCTPQVHGAARDTLAFVIQTVERELAAAIDNPMVMPDGRVESGGNFHGAPLGYAADFLAIALTDVSAISERRMDRMLDRTRSHGLSPFLAEDPGVDSGLMIGHYTAAAMLSENRRLSHPASTDSAPTSGMQEDHVSMAWGAARKLRLVIDNLRRILAVECVIAARGIDARAPLTPAAGTGAAHAVIRAHIAGIGPDRYLAPELATAEELVRHDDLLAAVNKAIGPLA